MSWIWPLTGGMAAAPLGAIAGLAIAYLALMATGVSEHEGRRGFLAAVYGILPGLIVGFWIGFIAVQYVTTQHTAWRSFAAGCALGLLLAVILFTGGLIGGIYLAEERGISNYAGERAAWSLFYIAMPLAALGGIGGFLTARALV